MLCSIIGSGRIGGTTAFLMARKGLCDIRLIDIEKNLAQGQAMDIMHAAHSGFSVEVSGSQNLQDIKDSDIVINTAGAIRKPGMDRLDLIKKNTAITKSIAKKIAELAPKSIVIQVSNPVDIMTYVMKKATGFPKERIMGSGSLLDAQRFALHLSRELKTNPMDIEAMVIGEHGESMVPLFSNSFFEGRRVYDLIEEGKRKAIAEKTRASAAEVIKLKGATVFAPSAAVTRTVDNIIKDRKETLPVSVFLDGEYGLKDLCIGVPAVIGQGGIECIMEMELKPEEAEALKASAGKLKKLL